MESGFVKDLEPKVYRGRIAPTPTGYMHLGHARTFLIAQERAKAAGGDLLMRIEDLDQTRCKGEFVSALEEDLRWAGLNWDEGPVRDASYGSCVQSERLGYFEAIWLKLRDLGAVFPCVCSRKDVQEAVSAPHQEGRELIYPGTCREKSITDLGEVDTKKVNWRFRVPDGERISFRDGNKGEVSYVAGEDFGDFLVWRKDGFPSYELAVVADDIAMEITEVVRGEDLLMSTARQILLYRTLGYEAPSFYHCELVKDENGERLAKRSKSVGLRELRARGVEPNDLMRMARI
ncbi:MAG: tRNA glutamyl-Q(34) synthetase GluQRS [Verrucomicrobiota bacterium]